MKVKLSTILTTRFDPYAFLMKNRLKAKWLFKPFIGFPGSRLRIATCTSLVMLTLYLVFCTFIVWVWAAPEALGTGPVRLGPDSVTYYSIGKSIEDSSNELPLLALGSNLIGPIAVVMLIGNPFAVALFNAVLLVIALWVASTIRDVNLPFFTALVLLDAETLTAVTTVNKEVFALFSAILFAKYIDAGKRSWLILFSACLSAVLARWEHLAVILLFLMFQRSKVFRERPGMTLLLVISGISMAWPFTLKYFDTATFDAYTRGARTMAVLNAIQQHFGYILVVVPKVIMNLIGAGSNPVFWFSIWPTMDHTDVQNSFIVRFHEIATTCAVGIALLTNKLSLRTPIIFFCALYLVVTCTNLFIQSRYDYPVYILICLTIASSRTRNDGAALPLFFEPASDSSVTSSS